MKSLAPWLWLVDFDARDRALDASDAPTGELTEALMAHFAEVHVLRAGSSDLDQLRDAYSVEGWIPASAAVGSVATAAWPNETFDCIALHDALVRRRLSTTEVQAELEAAHRLLKPGGWLALASPSPPRFRRRTEQTIGLRRTVLSRLLTRARFREIRCLFVAPSADDPSTVVPDVKSAIRARDTLEGVHGAAKWKHRAALELGFRPSLFPAYVLLAQA